MQAKYRKVKEDVGKRSIGLEDAKRKYCHTLYSAGKVKNGPSEEASGSLWDQQQDSSFKRAVIPGKMGEESFFRPSFLVKKGGRMRSRSEKNEQKVKERKRRNRWRDGEKRRNGMEERRKGDRKKREKERKELKTHNHQAANHFHWLNIFTGHF